jgi:hypothetical protein
VRTTIIAVLFGLVVLPRAAAAQEHGSVNFVSGMAVSQGNTLSTVASAVSPGFGSNVNVAGRLNLTIAPGFQAVGEAGRLSNVLPPLTTAVVSLSSYDVRASAFYGEAGVRALASPHSSVSPYVEATAGYAHLTLHLAGLNTTEDDLLALGFGLASRTSPLAGLGGGVTFHAGRLVLDAGYRYKKIFANNVAETLLNGGQQLTTHQLAFGVGVGF